jgi:hypothetical protein
MEGVSRRIRHGVNRTEQLMKLVDGESEDADKACRPIPKTDQWQGIVRIVGVVRELSKASCRGSLAESKGI